VCGDVTGWSEGVIDAVDFLAVMSECGNLIANVATIGGTTATCLEGLFSWDGIVTIDDAMAIGMAIEGDSCICAKTYCASTTSLSVEGFMTEQSGTPMGPCLAQCEAPLLIAGKRYDADQDDFLSDRVYGLDEDANLVCGPCASELSDQLNGKLVRDHEGQIYQVNLKEGLVRLSEGNSVVVVPNATFLNFAEEPRYHGLADVYVGRQNLSTSLERPIEDAAFDKDGYVYVTPVVVEPVQDQNTYVAVAKLELLDDSCSPPYQVVQLYDPMNPNDTLGPKYMNEIEVDDNGNLFGANVYHYDACDIYARRPAVWVYDTNGTTKKRFYLVDPNNEANSIHAPVALHVSNATGRLFLASSLNTPEANSTSLYVMAKDDLLEASYGLDDVNVVKVHHMGHITGITEDPMTGTVWVVGYSFWTMPSALEMMEASFIYNEPFYRPYVAQIPPGVTEVNAVCLSDYSGDEPDLALPLSIIWTGSCIDFSDYADFAQYWKRTDCDECEWCGGMDFDRSKTVDYNDLNVLATFWLESCNQ